MILALMLACSSSDSQQQSPAANVNQQPPLSDAKGVGGSIFLGKCSASGDSRVNTLDAIFDRVDSTNCKEVYDYLSTTKTLDLSNHPIPFSDISLLAEFTQIEELYLSDSRVADLSPLSGYTKLRKLYVEHCASIQNLIPLTQLSSLEELLVDYSTVSDLSPLKDLSNLKRLGLRNTSVRSLEGLSELTGLTSLEVSGTTIASLEPLTNLNNLQVLSLRETDVADLEPLAAHTDLFFLDLKDTRINDISPLKGLSNLKVLDIGNTNVTDLTPLKSLDSLLELNVQSTNVDASGCSTFSKVVQGCATLDDDTIMRLCRNPDEFVFATQVSMRSLKRDLKEKDCSVLKDKIRKQTKFSSSEPYPDPRVFEHFPSLKNIDIPVVHIFEEYCPENPTGVLKALCERKSNSMDARAKEGKDAFLEHCSTANEGAAFTYTALKAKVGVDSCDDLWTNLAFAERLTIQAAKLTNIEPLGYLPNVQELSVDYNDIRDLSPLSKLNSLQILWIDDNEIEDITPLKDLSLLWLSAGDNSIRDISALQNSTNLHRLWLGGNEIVDISPLKKITGLDKLHLAINEIEDASPIANMTDLSALYLGYNEISNIEVLGRLQSLRILSSGLDHEESPLEMQRWFLQGNPIDNSTCPTNNAPTAVRLFCSQYQ